MSSSSSVVIDPLVYIIYHKKYRYAITRIVQEVRATITSTTYDSGEGQKLSSWSYNSKKPETAVQMTPSGNETKTEDKGIRSPNSFMSTSSNS